MAHLVDDWTASFQQAQEATTPEARKELLTRKEAILKEIIQHVAAYENPDRRTKFQNQLNIVQAHENAMAKLDMILGTLGTDIPFGREEARAAQLLITTARVAAAAK